MDQPTKLMNRNFFLIWQGQAVSRLGSQLYAMAMILWIVEATNSATLMGLIAMVGSIPALILSPIGGTFADRHSRRAIIITSDILNGIVMIILATLVFVFSTRTDLIVVSLFIVSILSAIINSFFYPAISAAIPDLVPKNKISGANTLSQLSMQISMLIGQGLGGGLFRILGGPLIFLFDGLTYLFSAGSEAFITIPQKIIKTPANLSEQFRAFKTDLIDGLQYIWQRVGLRNLILVSTFLSFFVTPIIILFPFFVEKYLNLGERWGEWLGFLLAIYGASNLLGYIVAGFFQFSGKTRTRIMISFFIIESGLYGLLGLANQPLTVIILAVIAGFMSGYVSVIIITILQTTTPSEIRGRVFGLMGTLAGALTPLAMGLSGTLADLVDQNIPLIYFVCGAMMALLSVLVAFSKDFREYIAYKVPTEEIEIKPEETNVLSQELVD